MHAKNPDVQRVAVQLDRTASSVALKLVNFASLDPEHQRRGIQGMGNVSKLDRQVWEEFYGNWGALADAETAAIESDEVGFTNELTERLVTLQVRRGQAFFRRTVLAAYEDCCCITGITSLDLIRASHIIPWAEGVEHRLDPRNGLALNALHDTAFDRGLITLDDSLRVVLSRHLGDSMPADVYRSFFEKYAGNTIRSPHRFSPSLEHLEYHRNHVFLS